MLFLKPLHELNSDDIQEFCAQWREGVRVEYKPNMNSIKGDIPKIVSSFANYQGGILLIGVKSIDGKTSSPVNGFKKSQGEPRVTIQQACLHGINPPITPEIQIVEMENKKIVVVVSVNESIEAPHAIENSKIMYIRSGDFSEPYELAKSKLIEDLFQRRRNADKNKNNIMNGINIRLEKIKKDLSLRGKFTYGVPSFEIVVSPSLPYYPLLGLEDTFEFIKQYETDRNPFGASDKLKRAYQGIFSFWGDNYDFRFSEINQIGLTFIFKTFSNATSNEGDGHTIEIFESIMMVAKMLKFMQQLYEKVNYSGNIIVKLSLVGIYGSKVVFPWTAYRPEDPDDYISYDETMRSEAAYAAPILNDKIIEVIVNLFKDIIWAFTQKWISIPETFISQEIERILKINKYL